MVTRKTETVSTKLQWIAELSRRKKGTPLTPLAHLIDKEFLREAFRRTRKDGASGVDRMTAEEYAKDLEGNLETLLNRLKSGSYRAPPVKRVYIPKADGRKRRAIGIPTIEDKILQRAVTMVLNAIYEQDFLDCSYGFRPKRSAHQALEALWKELMNVSGGWVLDVDIQDFFTNLGHGHLRNFLDERVRDGVIRRAIGKWLKAGVMEEGSISYPESGSPQGGVVSPILANVYLHHVLDTWFQEAVKPRLKGRAELYRFADDVLIVCAREDDARRIMEVLPKRLEKYGLTMHPEKSHLADFRRPKRKPKEGEPRPGTFEFLGFTHYWGKTRKGKRAVKRKTAPSRFGRAVKRTGQWCKRNRHAPLQVQHAALSAKLRGHNGYYGITGNMEALQRFRYEVVRIWRKWLDRRSNSKRLTWKRFQKILDHYVLPPARVVHSTYKPLVAKPCL